MSKAGNSTREKIYEYIVAYTKEHLFPPTVDEIRKAVEVGSKQTVWYHLQMLEKQGLVELKRDTNRGIKLTGYELKKTEK